MCTSTCVSKHYSYQYIHMASPQAVETEEWMNQVEEKDMVDERKSQKGDQ